MFFKLLKYDLKSMLKTMIPLWITLIIISLFIGIQVYYGSIFPFSFLKMGSSILVIVFFALLVAVFVLNILIVIQRFWNGLLKDEGYLMFTLPVSVKKLILSKSMSALLISIASLFVCLICFFIIGASYITLMESFNMNMMLMALHDIFFQIDVGNILCGILLCIVVIAGSIYHMYAAMAIGHLSNRNRFLFSFAAYIIMVVILYVIEAPFTGYIQNVTDERIMLIGTMGITLIELVIYHVITELILTYKLNLE